MVFFNGISVSSCSAEHKTLQVNQCLGLRRLTMKLQQGFTAGEMGFSNQFAAQKSQAAHVADGSEADIPRALSDVCVTPQSGHDSALVPCPLGAKSGHLGWC
jgi:hypothetical protein